MDNSTILLPNEMKISLICSFITLSLLNVQLMKCKIKQGEEGSIFGLMKRRKHFSSKTELLVCVPSVMSLDCFQFVGELTINSLPAADHG